MTDTKQPIPREVARQLAAVRPLLLADSERETFRSCVQSRRRSRDIRRGVVIDIEPPVESRRCGLR
jgi:hypothetical protein